METVSELGAKTQSPPTVDHPASQPIVRPNARTTQKLRSGKAYTQRWYVIWPALAVIVAMGLWVWRREAATKDNASMDPAGLVVVTRGNVEKSVNSSGKVVSNLDVDIKCRASSEVIKLPFDISQSVKKGDLLCQLDPADQNLAVRLAEATVAQSTAKVAQARYDLQQAVENLATTRKKNEASLVSAKVKAVNLRAKADRQKQLIAQNLGSREDLETAETDAAASDLASVSAGIAIDELKQQAIQLDYKGEAVKTAEAQLQSDEVALATQKQQLAYTTVTAPLDGVVSALNVQKGTIVASGMNGFSGGTTIITLSDLSHVFVTATVDESDIGDVRVGQRARITVASFPTRAFDGQVARIAIKGVNASNVVTFEVKVEVLDEHKGLLRPEMTGNVTIVQAERINVLTLPSSALVVQGNQTFVTMSGGQRRPLVVGLQGAEFIEVISGVAAGERVAVANAELPTRWKSQERGPGGGPPPQ